MLLQINRELSQPPVNLKRKNIQKMLPIRSRKSKKSQLTSLVPLNHNQLKKLPKTFTKHSPLEISNKLILLQITSHQLRRILSRVDMLVCSSHLHQSKNPSSLSTKMSATSNLSMKTPSLSTYSQKMPVLVLKRSENWTLLLNLLPLSTHWQWNS